MYIIAASRKLKMEQESRQFRYLRVAVTFFFNSNHVIVFFDKRVAIQMKITKNI